MTQEEKARAYDEVLKQIKECTPDENGFITIYPQEIFSELKESEDEKIRKEIIDFLKLPHPQFVGKRDHEKWIAWLEKQAEQKSADKVEPKFKVGDWIINPRTGLIKHIKNVLLCDNNGNYEFESSSMSIDSVDNSFHLWTIQDAKDGDVLISDYEGGICIAILKSVVSSNEIEIYCHLINSELFIAQSGFSNAIWHPATKEQRDLLFEKMKEAGYLWNGLTKRLVNIKESGYEWDSKNKKYKNIEQKPAWSEDDEFELECVLGHLRNYLHEDSYIRYENWLKSLKERIIS